MEDNDRVVEQGQLPPTSHQSRLATYNFLVRMSKRMGMVATRSYVEVKHFLNQDITVDPTERFLAGMPKIRLKEHTEEKKSSEERDNASSSEGTVRHKSDEKKPESMDSQSAANTEGGREGQQEKEKSVEEGDNTVDVASNDLEKIISQSHEVLAQANTVFPVTLFPDTVLVDRTKVTIIKRDFFWSSDTLTFRIEDVLNAEVTVGPIFGSLTIASRVMSTTDHFRIDHFWRNDAIYLKRIIQGYIIAQHNKIDVAHLSKDELIKTLNELGHHRT